MLTRLHIKNFKTWDESHWDGGLELKPITVFLGKNSSGKTSLLQSIVLLKQTIESNARDADLDLGGYGGERIDFGSYSDIIHNHDKRAELGLGLTFLDHQGEPHRYRAAYTQRGDLPLLKTLTIERPSAHQTLTVRRGRGDVYSTSLRSPQLAARSHADASHKPEHSHHIPIENFIKILDEGKYKNTEDIKSILNMSALPTALPRLFERVAWLGPLRDRPQRTYLWGAQAPASIGSRGEHAMQALLYSAAAGGRDAQGGDAPGWLIERLSFWLNKMGIAAEVRLERKSASRYYELVVIQGEQESNLIDVGFGVSQILPIIVAAYYQPRGSVILIEQPELHLHPSAQFMLAELFVAAFNERQMQFIVETHSEHLLRRLQNLIASQEIDADDCRLYFINKLHNRSTIEQLKTNKYGQIDNWPDGFFGDTLTETKNHLKTIIERRRQDP